MNDVIVIEPNQDLRLRLVNILTQGLDGLRVGSQDYRELRQTAIRQSCKLAVLGVSTVEAPDLQIEATQQAHDPQAVLLLADDASLVTPSLCWQHPQIRGLVMRNANDELQLASARLVLAGGTCFPAYDRRVSRRRAVLSVYRPAKWPAPAREEHAAARSRPASNSANEAQRLGLTPRQYEVLVLLARGHPLKIVARQLDISVATAKAHTEALYQRLNVNSRNEAVFAAIEQGATLGLDHIQASSEDH